MQDVRMIPFFAKSTFTLTTSENRPISSIISSNTITQGGVIARFPGPSEQSSNDFLLDRRPTGLSIGLGLYKSPFSILVEKLDKAISFFFELISDPHVCGTSTNHLLYKYPRNALKILSTSVQLSLVNDIMKYACQLGQHHPQMNCIPSQFLGKVFGCTFLFLHPSNFTVQQSKLLKQY